ncbi:MAG: shikimate dehydrogenase, partial [Kiritimatiellae bacterium]|nr:shikimate dehydrogenase [Kiritimatiellia bacterium]
QFAFDLIYMFPETDFMVKASEAGAKVANGLGMLLHQGARAFELWTGRDAPVKVMRKVLEKEVYEKG